MLENLVKWPSKRWQVAKIRPSDCCRKNIATSGWDIWQDFGMFGSYLGNVVSCTSRSIRISKRALGICWRDNQILPGCRSTNFLREAFRNDEQT